MESMLEKLKLKFSDNGFHMASLDTIDTFSTGKTSFVGSVNSD
jgi:hypothetical protein